MEHGFIFIPFALFVIIGASNAVNLTDGLRWLSNSTRNVGSVIISL